MADSRVPGDAVEVRARGAIAVAVALLLLAPPPGCVDGESSRSRVTLQRLAEVASGEAPPLGLDAVDAGGDPADGDTTAAGDAAPPADTGPTPDTLGPTDTGPALADTLGQADTDPAPVDTAPGTDAGPVPPGCQVGDATGVCRHISACAEGEAAVDGLCDGGPQVRCCLAEAWAGCSAEGAAGACLETTACGAGWRSVAGVCPGPAGVQCCRPEGVVAACDGEAAPLPNEGLLEEPGDPGCLPGMVGVTAELCVDRFEASLVRADDPTVSLSPYRNPGATPARAVSLRWAVPQGYIDGVRAAAACEAAGKRLCTSAEWLRACRGPAQWTYPYGAAREPGRCNDARARHPAVEYFGTADAWIWSELGHPCINQLTAGLALNGERAGCQTAEGVHDMMGNLHEWVADAGGVFRGGFYVDTAINGQGCLYATTAHGPSHWDYSTGFRCCAARAPTP